MAHYDVIVLGLGAMGSATAYHLAKQKKRVLGLEQFDAANSFGSSHGETRIVRQAYRTMGEVYVPILRRAYEHWEALEKETAKELFIRCGVLTINGPGGDFAHRAHKHGSAQNVPNELLDTDEVRSRYPLFNVPDGSVGCYEPGGGFLFCEEVIRAHLDHAARKSAELRFNEKVKQWSLLSSGDGISVETHANKYVAEQLIITAGAWAPKLIDCASIPLQPLRKMHFWCAPKSSIDDFHYRDFPVYIWQNQGEEEIYGFPYIPKLGKKMKVGYTEVGEPCDPDTVDRNITEEEVTKTLAAVSSILPRLGESYIDGEVCFYTNTPNQVIVLGRHPKLEPVLLATGFSGHGFKMSSTIGEILAELVSGKQSEFDLSEFSPLRFAE